MKVVVCFTGGVGSQVIRLLGEHPDHELVGVLVHDRAKEGRDVGELTNTAQIGVAATCDVDQILALRPDCALWHGAVWDRETVSRFLRSGVNVYTGMAGFSVPLAEDEELRAACQAGGASLASGGNIPGLISDVLPLFLSGYTGNIRRIRATQRNHVAEYPSAHQLHEYLMMGFAREQAEHATAVDAIWLTAQSESAKLVAAGLGAAYGQTTISTREFALTPVEITLESSGLTVPAGTVAGVRWTFTTTTAEGYPFLDVVNEQTVALGLGAGWRQQIDEPNWTVEVDGHPSIRCQLELTAGTDQPVDSSPALNAARAVNFIPQLVAAAPGFVSVLDMPAPRGYLAG